MIMVDLTKKGLAKLFSRKEFRRSIAYKQTKLAMWCCLIVSFFSAELLVQGFILNTIDFVEPKHLIMAYVPTGIVMTVLFIIMHITRGQKDKWRIAEAATYATVFILPYWGLVVMNISVIEGRTLNFLIWAIGMLVASAGLYIVPLFSVINLCTVSLITCYSMYRFHYTFGESGYINLISFIVICIWISILRFLDGFSEYKKNEELLIAVDEADKANAAKGIFLTHMSHEIRTPINTVLGMDELILREAENTNVKYYAENIKSAGNMLLSLINDILDFSKIEAGKMELLPSNYHLASTLHDLVSSVYVKIKDKGLNFHVQMNEHTPAQLYGDELRVKQILLNLLTNAVKYTKSGEVILVVDFKQLEADMVELIISVKDTGIGIKEQDMNKLTQNFERIEESRNRSIEGSGLGMSITVQLLELMSGKLEVKSEYDQGSCFTVHIPQKVVNNQEVGEFRTTYEHEESPVKQYQCTFEAPDARILIVDDNRTNRILAKELLKETSIQVDLAESSFEFLEKIKAKAYDIIFLDHLMPEMDGVEALQKMKQINHKCNKAIIVALTANAVKGAKDFYLDAGFDDFLSKPIDPEKYELMIQNFLPKELVHILSSK